MYIKSIHSLDRTSIESSLTRVIVVGIQRIRKARKVVRFLIGLSIIYWGWGLRPLFVEQSRDSPSRV
jgi:hypothetical protein